MELLVTTNIARAEPAINFKSNPSKSRRKSCTPYCWRLEDHHRCPKMVVDDVVHETLMLSCLLQLTVEAQLRFATKTDNAIRHLCKAREIIGEMCNQPMDFWDIDNYLHGAHSKSSFITPVAQNSSKPARCKTSINPVNLAAFRESSQCSAFQGPPQVHGSWKCQDNSILASLSCTFGVTAKCKVQHNGTEINGNIVQMSMGHQDPSLEFGRKVYFLCRG
ncbi:hypothetical protein HPB50_008376 [Hyalomma asiaticum]|uniref:Uncharacterized protein n=1 Tax=Hyalomma asiaticum TaxID=266040 RepID=A0ACB7TH09_HYAAI|nr:hypothetical protein HPB50_008376 [Hyalomma asiaticum]